jgi:hypothetical protein
MKVFLLSVVCGVFLMATAQAQKAKTPSKPSPPPAPSAPAPAPAPPALMPPWVETELTPLEKEIVKQHLVDIRAAQKKKSAPDKKPPAGATKKAAPDAKLPPGWQKKIVRGELLPAAVYAQAQPLPDVVIRKLPPAPVGTILVTLDDKLVRLLEAPRLIVDVFELK